ncbi:hypothetical protein C9374_006229 [Naegleria lovaniensis]|uniref:Uncharacterized protein n=1 Tax=Naegleria lovaniensis TaxID=51637 RepID=A0AA88GJ41_NAELO|nr:uncharacterized protein C9374_008311 [Naegleria lovaniensis]XP_044547524.1 uncharacterized protein C9374_006229 [Naegleria lovaniensis]KAG2378424.1 hypothetical protein C9374_008311 [Naegleria lovaniensis]KAG2381845.1 hypothetical protein C9374_006229 [Naegleria lovaniensis]
MAGTKMHFHGVSRDLLTKWKKPIIIGLAAEITLMWGIYEAYYFNYNMNKNKYASYLENRHRGLKPPYEVDYNTSSGSVYKVDWKSFREDVQ